jgi:2-amino-4-hydroxy-6-hydroxymethyldihydropteridine diphosphokinase
LAEALLALGGNIGDVRSAIARAIALLDDDRDIRVVARSSDYLTPPWGIAAQPAFVNAVIVVATSLAPDDLFARAVAVEQALGRDRNRETRWGPRTIDIDLIAYDDVARDDAVLTLPHPRWSERAFVVVPLAEIAPNRMIGGLRPADVLARIDSTGIRKLD